MKIRKIQKEFASFKKNFRSSALKFLGFTLIELMVAFTVISILSTVGLAAFVNFSKSQSVKQAASDLTVAIESARSRAISQTIPAGVPNGCPGFSGYSVNVDVYANTYVTNIICTGNNPQAFPLSAPIPLPSGVMFAQSTTDTSARSIVFSVLTDGVSGFGSIGITGSGQSACISINSAGSVDQSPCTIDNPVATPTLTGTPPTNTPTVTIGVATNTPTPTGSIACTTVNTNSFFGCYYDNQDLTNLKITRTDPSINFSWPSGSSPDPSIGSDTFSVRWQGNFTFNAGNYNFTAASDDGIRVYIDGVLVLDKWVDRSLTTDNFSQVMTAGTHLVKVEYYENAADATAQVSWVQGSLPTSTPTATPTTAACTNTPNLATDADHDGYRVGAAGTQCTKGSSVISGRTYYTTDGVNYVWLATAQQLSATVDCYDSGTNASSAFPGQTAYFTSPRGDGSYDYNCVNGNEKQNTSAVITGTGDFIKVGSGACTSASRTLYTSTLASCGQTYCSTTDATTNVYATSACSPVLGRKCSATATLGCR